jgi:hypothetical protein
MSGGFRRSSAFGIVGVIVVMIACAVIALQYGSGTARPTGALIVIVALVFGFMAVLMVLQRIDLNRVSGKAQREALSDPGPVARGSTRVQPEDDRHLRARGRAPQPDGLDAP